MVSAVRLALAAALAAAGWAGGMADSDAEEGAAAVPVSAAAPNAARARELIALLKHDCGSCHGMRLTGGLGPALTAEALRAKPADSLAATIVSGRPGTAMPPWRRFLSEAEAQWLVARMVSGDVDAH